MVENHLRKYGIMTTTSDQYTPFSLPRYAPACLSVRLYMYVYWKSRKNFAVDLPSPIFATTIKV